MKTYAVVVVYSDGYERVESIFLSERAARRYAEGYMQLNLYKNDSRGRIERIDIRETSIKVGETVATVTREWIEEDIKAMEERIGVWEYP